MQLYVVRAPSKLSNGKRLNGRCFGFSWTEGFAGPFDQRRAKQVSGMTGGAIHGFGSVPEKAVMRELQRIEDRVSGETLFEEEKALPDLTGEDSEETSEDDVSDEEADSEKEAEGFEAVEETAEELSESEVNVFPEDPGYHEMIKFMNGEDFDYKEHAEDRTSEEITRVYKEKFLPSRSL